MSGYVMPVVPKPPRVLKRQVQLIANGDLRQTANRACWRAQAEMELGLTRALDVKGFPLVRAHPYRDEQGHGFIASQSEGMCVFADIDPKAPLLVAEAVWQYSHHILHGLIAHEGPILSVANWSGQWPGLVGMLNLNGCMTKASVEYSTLWSKDFTDEFFRDGLRAWLTKGRIKHDASHVTKLKNVRIRGAERKLGEALAKQLMRDKAIMGVFDEGCMGMFNAIIPDELLNPLGVYKERLSQSALYYATTRVSDDEAREVRSWMEHRGMRFETGQNEETDLTDAQIHQQCKM